ncbi:nitroreductase/quinone reductase family protein [Kitasatospora sp. NPDC088548]|uniref:nitroreductase/quinone reductase family protein n=1 Tax=Kitasatospora sp. NPDC088548 TaxID=3364075 RepID=UPI00380A67A3
MRYENAAVIEEFRANGGKVGGRFTGLDMVLLTTTGARTGASHTTPLACFTDGDRLFVIASNGGSDRHPDWYHNLVAQPELIVETGHETYRATAAPVMDDAEHDRLYALAEARRSRFAEFRASTGRRIPVLTIARSPDTETETATDTNTD